VQVPERTKGGDAPGGGILEVVAWQPNFLDRARESAQEGDNLAFVAYAAVCLEIVWLGTPPVVQFGREP
jgi:hypothetical protein